MCLTKFPQPCSGKLFPMKNRLKWYNFATRKNAELLLRGVVDDEAAGERNEIDTENSPSGALSHLMFCNQVSLAYPSLHLRLDFHEFSNWFIRNLNLEKFSQIQVLTLLIFLRCCFGKVRKNLERFCVSLVSYIASSETCVEWKYMLRNRCATRDRSQRGKLFASFFHR